MLKNPGRSRFRRTLGCLVLAAGLLSATIALAGKPHITLASTTSTEQSGLFHHIIPTFTEATGIEVRVVAVGTGQAFAMARAGDADALLVHDTTGEKRFIEDGYGIERREVMYNDFVIIGPSGDPAGIADAESAIDAMQRIAEAEAAFASRGDDSGTHRAELRLWQEAGVEPGSRWYRELGSGMGATLNTAAAMDAYLLSDRASWLGFRNRQELVLLFEGDEVLFNAYGSVLIDPERHPHLKHDLAGKWHDWLVSEVGQTAISEYRIDGEQVFLPY
ncbi:substrate-binding domain-containing protein [Methylonatrum kenyense]|uniref:substrate-binding domain-containing protein n=1 Tax=Methylonatrum kenyense TaxID=455253 RepID=UPI0020C0A930|nr:substrate-binding domain-containing protein [Methylonatrum kenyense]MCK8517298.1 substrate-binding domain-containing protein [Methylonatrum kenyense]